MKTETKIGIIIIPVALLGLFLFVQEIPKSTVVAEEVNAPAPTPQVLGTQTSQIRGIPLSAQPSQPPTFNLISPLNTADIKASSFYAYDPYTGQVLAEKNADTRMGIASITKLLTVFIAYQFFDINETTAVTSQDLIAVTPVAHLKTDEAITYRNLIDAVLVGSANDAAQVIGNRLAEETGKPVAQVMNEYAASLSMRNSAFSNPLGFDSEANFSTARDISLLIEALRPFHDYARTGRITNFQFRSESGSTYRVRATNKLVAKDPGLVGIKTGYTEGALGSMVTEFELEGRKIVLIVLGSTSRESDTAGLKATILKNYVLSKL